MDDRQNNAEQKFFQWLPSAVSPSALKDIQTSYIQINALLVKSRVLLRPIVNVELENTLIAGLNSAGISYCRNGRGTTLPGLISLSFWGKDGEAILHRMDLMGISISTGSACDSVNTETSHVLQAIRLDDNYAKGTIRVSLGKNNTKEDAEKIAAALVKIVG